MKTNQEFNICNFFMSINFTIFELLLSFPEMRFLVVYVLGEPKLYAYVWFIIHIDYL